MKKLFGFLPTVFLLLLAIVSLTIPQPVSAADVRTGNNVIISQSQTNLKDLYLFGKAIDLSAPVTNDVVAAGGNISISGTISNNLSAAGGTITVSSAINNTARVAGGNVIIEGPVKNDLAVAGGSVTVSKHASVGGDLLAAGGQVQIAGPIKGKILMSGGDITINSVVGGNVNIGHVDTLTLGPEAKINGTLTYNSPQPLTKDPGSIVKGTTTYHHVQKQEHQKQANQVWFGFSIYQLLVEIILSILLISFMRNALSALMQRMSESPWKSLGIGIVYVILAPIVSLILLVLLPLGLVSLFLYFILLILSIFIRDIFVGWFLLHWWKNRSKKQYYLDWRAGVLGPIIIMLINLIPILGWLITAIISLIGIGALLIKFTHFTPQLQTPPKKK